MTANHPTLLALLAGTALATTSGLPAQVDAADAYPGVVFTATNDSMSNSVLGFRRDPSGNLSPAGSWATGGLGTGDGLGNQGGVILSDDRRYLFVVNAGSDDFTVFRVQPGGLQQRDVADSGGRRPISLTIHHDLLYVLNAGGRVGGVDNIAGFRILNDGEVVPLAGASQPLSQGDANPAQIGFTPDGGHLIVTEKATNSIDVYAVDGDGFAGPPATFPSAGPTPFGFDFDRRGRLLVSEAAGGAPDASSVSAYELTRQGDLVTLVAALPTTESAACWLVVSTDRRYAYVTNTRSNTVTGLAVPPRGGAMLLDPGGVTAMTGAGPIDAAFSTDGRFLYTLNSGDGTISGFRRAPDGSLTVVVTTMAIAHSMNGLAAM